MDTSITAKGGRKGSIIFLQIVTVLIGVGVLALMLWAPHIEGRNVNATLFEIYFKDPFLAYVYIASSAFFVGLYKAFKVLAYTRQNKVFSQEAVNAIRTIKQCTIILSILIVMAAVYIRIFHNKDDDPAGFIALSIVAIFISVVFATAMNVFESILQNAVNARMKG